MKQLYYRSVTFFNVLQSKIAFYPSLLAVFGFVFALFMTYLENQGISKYLVEHAPSLVVNNGDTAKTILSSFISGLISVVDIRETEDSFSVEVAAPGKAKEDFNIELDNDVLTISSEDRKENESSNKEGRFTRREFSYKTFKRAFSLPDSVDNTKISASYNNGVLEIALPKREEAKIQAKRLIDIS